MNKRVAHIPVRWARRMPDPTINGVYTHFMLVPANSLPAEIPLDPNPREQNVNRPVYRTVQRSLRQDDEGVPGTFHLKHRGITLIASHVKKIAKGGPGGSGPLRAVLPVGIRDRGRWSLLQDRSQGSA